jgi:hypothetical protein
VACGVNFVAWGLGASLTGIDGEGLRIWTTAVAVHSLTLGLNLALLRARGYRLIRPVRLPQECEGGS